MNNNLIITHIVAVVLTSAITLFYQYYDDTKNNIKRKTIWEYAKLPILMSAIVCVIFNINQSRLGVKDIVPVMEGGIKTVTQSVPQVYTEMPGF